MGGSQAGMQAGQRGNQGAGMQTRQRLRIHATDQQRAQYRTCTQSLDRLRTRIRDMNRIMNSAAFNKQQALQAREQLRNELRTMQQEHDRWVAGLDDEQKAAVSEQLQQMSRTRQPLEDWSEALGFELEQESVDSAAVRDQLRKLDKATRQLQQQQRDVASDLALE
jgi:chromosome segregation ATPase